MTQRGNRCQRTFFRDEDYGLYLTQLRFWCRKSGTAVWAWCLMPNHVHLVWSSARAHLDLADDSVTDLSAARERIEDWRALLDSGLSDGERDSIRAGERTGRPLGGPAFLDRLSTLAGRRVRAAPAR